MSEFMGGCVYIQLFSRIARNQARLYWMDEIEQLLMDHLKARGPDFATARELALETGESWRKIARVLIRLEGRAMVEIDSVSWVSSKGRRRRCNAYRRAISFGDVIFPAWLMPRAEDVVIGFANHKERLDAIL